MIQSFWEIKKLHPLRKPFCRAGAGRSFVKNFICMHYLQAANTPSFSFMDIGGQARSLTSDNASCAMNMAGGGGRSYSLSSYWIASEKLGVVLGTGTTAVAYNNYAMASLIAHGTGAGQLLHWGGLIQDTVVSAPYAWFDMMRIFENQSGGDITIKELGLQAFLGQYVFLICRDVLQESDWVTLHNTEFLKVTYRIRVTV